MALRERTARQQLIVLYDDVIKENLRNRYVVHCTDGKRVVEASDRAMKEDYIQAMQQFGKMLDEVIEEFGGCTDNVPLEGGGS